MDKFFKEVLTSSLLLLFSLFGYAQNLGIKRSVIGSAGSTMTTLNNELTLSYSIAQASPIGIKSKTNIQISEGFIQPLNSRVVLKHTPEYKLFPNPTDGKFSLLFSELPDDNVRISVYGLDGRQVLLSDIGTQRNSTFYLGHLPGGVYIVRIVIGNNIATISDKIIIE